MDPYSDVGAQGIVFDLQHLDESTASIVIIAGIALVAGILIVKALVQHHRH